MANGESLNIQALQARALELWEIDQTSALELGKALLAVREAMREPHGAFAQWWRANGLEENRVYYCLRKAEGKVSPPKPAAEVYINNRNLCIAKYAPSVQGKFNASAVRIGPDGTTVTDGKMVLNVSLPAQEMPPAALGPVPASFLQRLEPKKSPTLLSFKEETIACKDDDGIAVSTKKYQGDFPAVERWLEPSAKPEPLFEIEINDLQRFVSAIHDFVGSGHILLSLQDGCLRTEIIHADEQKFTGLCLAQGLKLTPLQQAQALGQIAQRQSTEEAA